MKLSFFTPTYLTKKIKNHLTQKQQRLETLLNEAIKYCARKKGYRKHPYIFGTSCEKLHAPVELTEESVQLLTKELNSFNIDRLLLIKLMVDYYIDQVNPLPPEVDGIYLDGQVKESFKQYEARKAQQQKDNLLQKAELEAAKRNQPWLIVKPDGTKENITDLKNYCREKGLDYKRMISVANGNLAYHLRYKCRRLD